MRTSFTIIGATLAAAASAAILDYGIMTTTPLLAEGGAKSASHAPPNREQATNTEPVRSVPITKTASCPADEAAPEYACKTFAAVHPAVQSDGFECRLINALDMEGDSLAGLNRSHPMARDACEDLAAEPALRRPPEELASRILIEGVSTRLSWYCLDQQEITL